MDEKIISTQSSRQISSQTSQAFSIVGNSSHILLVHVYSHFRLLSNVGSIATRHIHKWCVSSSIGDMQVQGLMARDFKMSQPGSGGSQGIQLKKDFYRGLVSELADTTIQNRRHTIVSTRSRSQTRIDDQRDFSCLLAILPSRPSPSTRFVLTILFPCETLFS